MRRGSLILAGLTATFILTLAVLTRVNADPVVGNQQSYRIAHALDAVGQATTVYNVPAAAQICKVTIYGTFVGTVYVYTSVDQVFVDDQVTQKTFTAPGSIIVPVTNWKAIRAQTLAYTSGDPIAAIDCGHRGYGGQLVEEPAVEPTPTPTPSPTPTP